MAVPSDSAHPGRPAGRWRWSAPRRDPDRVALEHRPARFRRRRLAMFGLVVLVLLFLLAFVGPYLDPVGLHRPGLQGVPAPPSADHWFGTTQTGGDVFALTLRGMQKSLIIGLLVALISTGLAAVVGAFAGYFGGWVDRALMWFVDLLLVLPGVPDHRDPVADVPRQDVAGLRRPARGVPVDGHRADRARHDDLAARAGVRPGGALHGRAAPQDHLPPHPAEHRPRC